MSGSSQQYVIDTLSAKESWRLFRIMAEMVEGIDTLSALPPCVSIFGSARSKPEDELYRQTQDIAHGLVKAGYGVITGGSGQQGSDRGWRAFCRVAHSVAHGAGR